MTTSNASVVSKVSPFSLSEGTQFVAQKKRQRAAEPTGVCAVNILSYLPIEEIVAGGAVCKTWRGARDRAIQQMLSKTDVDNRILKAVIHYLYTNTKVSFFLECGLPASAMMKDCMGAEDLSMDANRWKMPQYFTVDWARNTCYPKNNVDVYCGSKREKGEKDLNFGFWLTVPNKSAPDRNKTLERIKFIMQGITSLNVPYNEDDSVWAVQVVDSYCLPYATQLTSLKMNNLKGPDGYKRDHRDFPYVADDTYAFHISHCISSRFPNLTSLTLATETAPQSRSLDAIAALKKLKRLSLVYNYREHLAEIPLDPMLKMVESLPKLKEVSIVRHEYTSWGFGPYAYTPAPAQAPARLQLGILRESRRIQKLQGQLADLEAMNKQFEEQQKAQPQSLDPTSPGSL